MSELKDYNIMDIEAMDDERLEKSESGKIQVTRVYIKSEADKVIAELKQKLNEAQTELELWRDGSIISESHQKELDEKHHSYYKRCLAMARWCASEEETYRPLGAFCGNESKEELFYARWADKWLELAEKFKPNNEVNNG